MAERGLQDATIRWLNAQRATIARVNGPGPAHVVGDPDVYGCYDGIMFQIELKTETGKLSRAQRLRLEEWDKVGAKTMVARSLEEVKDFWWRELFPDGCGE